MSWSRRRLIGSGLAGLTVGPLAGCLGDDAGASTGYGAFFTLAVWGEAVAGDHREFESPVPLGRVGHGWEPDVRLSTELAEAAVFIYPDLPSFAWAQSAATTLRRDYDDVAIIDVLDGVDLLPIGDDHAPDGDDHAEDAGAVDPHAWVDPVRAQTMVETIADGLASADPGHAADYRAKADEYVERLQALHGAFVESLSDADRDVAVLAGHNSFRYLARRYGFEIVTPRGVAPDASPSPTEIADVIDVVDANDIDVILSDVFASDELAETIVQNSTATEIREVTPAEGTTEAWQAEGWGYIDQMEAVNRPAFDAALNQP